jgi:SAM-dependent methyltransferase
LLSRHRNLHVKGQLRGFSVRQDAPPCYRAAFGDTGRSCKPCLRGHPRQLANQELVASEDYQNNLAAALHEIADWKDTTVLEAGVGTGRVKKTYISTVRSAICCDRAAHMLAHARRELGRYAGKTKFVQADNLGLQNLGRTVDLCVEGWSFGHSVAACEMSFDVRSVTVQLLFGMLKNLREDGTAILIETLGTGVDSARATTAQFEEF